MNNFLTQETPGKVLGLLGVALTSMFFLFMVTVSNANFSGQMENPVADPFTPVKVMAALDVASNNYSNFVYASLINPLQAQYQFVADNVQFVAQNAGPQIVQLAGLEGLGQPSVAMASQPTVAGASVAVAPHW